MTDERRNHARREIVRKAAEMGIDRDYISILVDDFYGRVRTHDILGPVFNDAIGDNWDVHLHRMKDFWASVTLNAGLYSGKPVVAHRKHRHAIQETHFDIWLGLFRQTLDDTAPTTEAVDYFMVRAERIAKSLILAIFGMPGLGEPKYG